VRKSHGISIILGSIKKREVACFFDPALSWLRDPTCKSVPRLGKLWGLLHFQLLKTSDTVPAAMGSMTALQCAGKEAFRGDLGIWAPFYKRCTCKKRQISCNLLSFHAEPWTLNKLSHPLLLHALFKAIALNSACPLISMLHPKPLNGGQYALWTQRTAPNEYAKLSNSSLYYAPFETNERQSLACPLNLMRRPKRLHQAYHVLCSMHCPKALRCRRPVMTITTGIVITGRRHREINSLLPLRSF
jgi:hypothetical protein